MIIWKTGNHRAQQTQICGLWVVVKCTSIWSTGTFDFLSVQGHIGIIGGLVLK